jgi:intracellular multiplication protein IcmL
MQDEEVSQGMLRVLTRNLFYRKRFHMLLGFCLLAVVFDLILGMIAWYLLRHPVEPLYFPTDKAGRLIYEVPLEDPNLSEKALSDWIVHAVEAAYSYDFINYRRQLQNAQAYFTDSGWGEYMKGLDRSRNLVGLVERKMVAIAKVFDVPVKIKEGLMGGKLAWKFEVRVVMHYQMPPFDGKSDYENPLIVTVVVQRQDILQGQQGLGIVQLNAFAASG